jgi:hypothetical protein
MKTDITMTNESFSFLRNSSDFLNIILNNINSCVLLLDREMRLKSFNDALKTIFTNKQDEDLLYVRCGEAIGCAYQIEEQKDCGNTSQCCDCEIRISVLSSYMDNKIVYKTNISRPYFDINNQKVNKNLHFSTRLFKFKNEKYIILIIEDITKFVLPGNANKMCE